MSFKTLIDKRTNEFVVIVDFSGQFEIFTSNIPKTIFNNTTTFEDIREQYKTIDFSQYDLIEFDLIKPNEVGEDIRNKLSPIKNLLKILKNIDFSDENLENRNKKINIVLSNIEKCENSINYIANKF